MATLPRFVPRAIGALPALVFWLSSTAGAQPPSAGVIGRLHDDKTGEVVREAVIRLDSVRRDVSISSQGRFVLSKLAPGRHLLEILAIGYRPQAVEFTLAEGQVLERQFPMVFTGDQLADLSVEARNSKLLRRFADFERRRQVGLGTYITRDEIRARGYMSMGDALRTVHGVRVNCGAVECVPHMVSSAAGCYPIYYVDGQLARSFAATTPISDVQGIEVYRGAGEVPGEFAGSGAMCGVIAIWTRAAP
jgi:hypothetical protein